jgi:hypothetical protein
MSKQLFQSLPVEIEDLILSFRMDPLLLNKTKGEYIEYTTQKYKKLLKKTEQKQVVVSRKMGEKPTLRVVFIGLKPWNRTDKMVMVPFHLESHVRSFYSKVDI